MILRILGFIDIASAMAFLFMVFGFNVFTPYLLVCGGLLLVKGMFILLGDILSVIDLVSALALLLSVFFVLPTIILWFCAFLLLAKGVVSFI